MPNPLKSTRTDAEITKLVEDNMPLAKFFVRRWPTLPEADALSVAMEGLLSAARGYNEARGIPFGTFAAFRIRHFFWRHYRKTKALKRGGASIIFSADSNYEGEFETSFLDSYISNEAAPDREIQIREAKEIVKSLLPHLNDQERIIITHRFGIGTTPKTLESIASKAGCNNRERTRQVEAIALRKLRFLHPENQFKMAIA